MMFAEKFKSINKYFFGTNKVREITFLSDPFLPSSRYMDTQLPYRRLILTAHKVGPLSLPNDFDHWPAIPKFKYNRM